MGGQKGHAGVGFVILLATLVVFLFFPLYAVLFEKAYGRIVQTVIQQQVHSSMRESIKGIEWEAFSQQEVTYSAQLRSRLEKALQDNMRLGPDMYPQTTSIADDQVIIEDLDLFDSAKVPWTDLKGVKHTRPGMAVTLIVPIQPHFYNSQVTPEGRDTIDLKVYQVYTLPVNR